MQAVKTYNRNVKFLLTCIDVFSKYAWVQPLKDKSSSSLVTAFKTILNQGRIPDRLQSDKGTEFLNAPFQKLLKENNIHFFTSENVETKASVVERFNRTLKNKIYRFFTKTGQYKYVDKLQDFVNSYNFSIHGTIGMRPVDVTLKNEDELWLKMYSNYFNSVPKNTNIFQIGDRVRISKEQRVFEKGYLPKWTREVFIISSIIDDNPLRYKIVDFNNEPIKGSFYSEELQKVIQ